MLWSRVRCVLRSFVVLLAVLWSTTVVAAPATSAPTVEAPAAAEVVAPPTAPPPSPAEARMRQRAERIEALIRGELDTSVEPRQLFVLDLDDAGWAGPGGELVLALLQEVDRPAPDVVPPEEAPREETSAPKTRGRSTSNKKARDEAPAPVEEVTPPAPVEEVTPAQALRNAYATFLRLPEARQAELFAEHRQRQEVATADLRARDARRAAADEATRTADRLEAYLGETLDPEIDPNPLLRLDLLEPNGLGTSEDRRRAWVSAVAPAAAAPPPAAPAATPAAPREGDAAPDPAEPPAAPPDPSVVSLRAAQSRLDTLRRKYLSLSADDRTRLSTSHRRRIEEAAQPEPTPQEVQTAEDISHAELEAQRAAREREEALEAAKRAKTEARRILAEERARLLGVKEAQAHYEADLNRRRSEVAENHDKALEWSRKVAELRDDLIFASEKAARADPMYPQIRRDLRVMRIRLREELGRVREAGASVPRAGRGMDQDLPADVDRGDLEDLRQQVQSRERELIDLEKTVAWDLAQGLRDDVVLLNRARLSLLEVAGSDLRDSVTGFGTDGVDQARRELDQISVELAFQLMKIPRSWSSLPQEFEHAAIPVFIGVVQVLAVLAGFVWWRRRGSDLLKRMQRSLGDRRPAERWTSVVGTQLWFFNRVRKPLEWLLLFWIFFRLFGRLESVSLNLAWIVALWVSLGWTVVLFVDALASRETLYSSAHSDNAELRLRSLRLVGINVIMVGLILSLTAEIVGRGAIYRWVISTCWVLSFPVAFYLLRAWKPIIFERLERRSDPNALVRWAMTQRAGIGSFPAATVAAVYLVGGGIGTWAMRQLSGLEATRRLLAYMFRREVARQAAAALGDDRYTPVGPEIRAIFDPERLSEVFSTEAIEDELRLVVSAATSARPTITVVVGERGLGKSCLLSELRRRAESTPVHIVRCPDEGIDGLLGRIAAIAGDASLRDEDLCQALRKLGSIAIAVDDLQRLVTPAVNGLVDLDRLMAFARSVRGEISWVVTIGAAAWHYIRRARGERVFFEQIVELPRWSEEQLGDLIQARCSQAGIDPSFEGLVVPRRTDAPLPDQGDRTEAGYYRLLWDFSRGNPAVALHAFRESLFRVDSGAIVVRLFKEPPPEEVESLPLGVLFVLRAIVQLELATVGEVESATQLPTADIDDAFRFCLTRGYVELHDGGVRVSWPWYRTVTTVLQRQHLLSKL